MYVFLSRCVLTASSIEIVFSEVDWQSGASGRKHQSRRWQTCSVSFCFPIGGPARNGPFRSCEQLHHRPFSKPDSTTPVSVETRICQPDAEMYKHQMQGVLTKELRIL